MSQKTDILRAIDDTYKRWDIICHHLAQGDIDMASGIYRRTSCSICEEADYCKECPIIIEYSIPVKPQACLGLRVVSVPQEIYYRNVYYSTDRFLVVIQRLLRCIDNLRKRVRCSNAYEE